MRNKPTKYYLQLKDNNNNDEIEFLDKLPFERISDLLTSLCGRLTLYQWRHYDVYKKETIEIKESEQHNKAKDKDTDKKKEEPKEEEKKEDAEKEKEKKDKDKDKEKEQEKDTKIVKLRVGDNRIKAMQKLLILLECDHSAQSLIILLNPSRTAALATRTTGSLATIFQEVHHLEGLDLDRVTNENSTKLSQLFDKLIETITKTLCIDRGLLLSVIGPQLCNVLVPVFIDDEYQLIHKHEIIEIISNHIKYIIKYKIDRDSSFKQKFKWNKFNDNDEEKNEMNIQNNLAINEENVILDKIQRGLINALTRLVNQICLEGASKLRFIRKQSEKERQKDKDNKDKKPKQLKLRTFSKSEILVLNKLMDLFYERIDICCDVLNSRRAIKPSLSTLITRNNHYRSNSTTFSKKSGRKRSKSKDSYSLKLFDSAKQKPLFNGNPFETQSPYISNIKPNDYIKEAIYILRREVPMGDKSPNRPYIDTTKDNLLLQGRYKALSNMNTLQSNLNSSLSNDRKNSDKSSNKRFSFESSKSNDLSHKPITLLNAFDPPSVVYNFSISFWIKPKDTKIIGWLAKTVNYRGTKGQMHPCILLVGSHPTISASFTVIGKDNKTKIVELLCPLPNKTSQCFNKWYHIVVTLKDNKISIVINGESAQEITFDGKISPPPTQFYNVGKLASKSTTTSSSKTQIEGDENQRVVCSHIFVGSIKEIKHYFIPLSITQIKQIYDKKFEIKNSGIESLHNFGYKSLGLLSILFTNHSLVEPFFFKWTESMKMMMNITMMIYLMMNQSD